MKIKEDYLIQSINNETLLIPVGKVAEDFRGVIRLNETAAFMIEQLKEETDTERIVDALQKEYNVDRSKAVKDTETILDQLNSINALE